jgi:ubiquitin-conjugating enzyme (huntingtin interacting protein 2)
MDPANAFNWTLVVAGPADTPYAGGNFQVSLEFPDNYPFKSPEAKFITKVYHPNVSRDTGEICADVFVSGWSPTLNARFVIEALCSMFLSPNPSSPVEPEIAAQMTNDPAAFEATAR